MRKKRKERYQIRYWDPADPKGERWKIWKFKTLKEAKAEQADLSRLCLLLFSLSLSRQFIPSFYLFLVNSRAGLFYPTMPLPY